MVARGLAVSDELAFVAAKEHRPLPRWARWFIELGREVVEAQAALPDGERVVAVASAPTRGYAALSAALGASAAAFEDWRPEDMRSHFERLANLPPGTLVTWREGGYIKCGQLDGAEFIAGDDYLRMNGGSYRRKWNMTQEIHQLGEGEEPFMKRRLTVAAGFVEGSLAVDPYLHALHSSPTCVIVGVKSLLIDELTAQRFSCASGATGTLQDLLRCRAVGNGAATHYRSELVAAYGSEVPMRLQDATPKVVICDGASASLRWRSRFPHSPVLTVLDRASRQSIDAESALMGDRSMSVSDLSLMPEPVPPAIELLAFVEDT